MKKALTIAGSDPSGGAGIQADLKTFGALRVYGMAVVTSLTAQNTIGVQGTYDIPAEFVGEQIDSIIEDMGFDAVKTGMLSNSEIVETVSRKIKKHRTKKLVVDPVMVSKDGSPLLDADGCEAMMRLLFPLAFLLTPNIPEAEVISKIKIRSVKDMEKAAKIIKKTGVKNVLIKGGHLDKTPVDVLFDGKTFTRFELERVRTKNTHGTGCTLSSAITAELAKGASLKEAIQRAKLFLHTALRHAFHVGKGKGPVHHFAALYRKVEERELLDEISDALRILKEEKIGSLIPEVQSNLAAGLSHAATRKEVAAFPGRIVRDGQNIAAIHSPAFGASSHIADIVLTNMRYDPSKRACMNLCYDKAIIDCCKKLKLSVASFDRSKEPERIRDLEGSSLEWGVMEAIQKSDSEVPDIVFDQGGWGKEAMIRISAAGPLDVARLVIRIKRGMKK